MATTTFYVELLIIGFEVCTWLVLLLASRLGIRWLVALPTNLKDYALLVTLLTFGLAYLLGIIFDKVAHFLVGTHRSYIQTLIGRQTIRNVAKEKEDDVRQIYARVVTEEGQTTSQVLYGRTKVRILRASVLNVPLIALAAAIFFSSRVGLQWWPIVPAALVFWLMTVGTYLYTQRLYWARLLRFKKYLEQTDARQNQIPSQNHLTTPNTPV
ncbi:MAG: hypothetical protein PVF47_00820 [Anaerolineae bacterium]|jgi:hypothetical protein